MSEVPVPPAADAKPIVDATKSWVERVGFGNLHHNGVGQAASKGWSQVKDIVGKDVSWGARGKGFARVGAVGVGAYIAAGAFNSKDADGNDRSALVRVGQAVLGTGLAAGGVLAGGRV